jgi:hypothetical protein
VDGQLQIYMLLQCEARAVAECWMGWCSAVSKNGFTGTLPSELGKLTAVTYFIVSNNGFTGTLPSELGKLIAATYL